MWARFIALDILPVKQISKEVPSLLGDDGKTINSLLKTLLSNADDHVYKSYRSVRQASDINVDSFVRESEKRAEEGAIRNRPKRNLACCGLFTETIGPRGLIWSSGLGSVRVDHGHGAVSHQ